MRYVVLIGVLGLPLLAQNQANCRGIGRDVDVRCACVKDPSSKLCEMVKAGFYDTDRPKTIGKLGWGAALGQVPLRTQGRVQEPVRPQQARVVPLTHKDYLRFLHPNSQFAAGFNFEKLFRSPDLMEESLSGQTESAEARNRVTSALKEMDRLWLSFAAPNDIVVLATGRFERGAAAGMFY